jgi:hypothetical protein
MQAPSWHRHVGIATLTPDASCARSAVFYNPIDDEAVSMRISLLTTTALLLAMLVGPASAQYVVFDIIGNVWESSVGGGGPNVFPPSDPGDQMFAVGFVDGASQALTPPLGPYEYTYYFSNLVSGGQIVNPANLDEILVSYAGGNVEIHTDQVGGGSYTVGDYGINPPNASAPGTFTDGSVYLIGHFTQFNLRYNTVRFTGSAQGVIVFTADQNGPLPPTGNSFLFEGIVGPQLDPLIPQGYNLELDGQIFVDSGVPAEQNSWGKLKALYKN